MPQVNRSQVTVTVLAALSGLIALLPWVERGAEGANIETYGDSLWYAIVTLTTVGYGGKAPVTPEGKIIGAIFVLASLGVLGLLIGQIGEVISNYQERRRLGHHGYEGSGHIVVLGWNRLIEDVVHQLLEAERDLVVVTDDKHEIDEIHETFATDRVFPLYAPYQDFEMLRFGNLEESARIMVGIRDDTTTLLALLNLKRQLPDTNFVVEAQHENLLDTFRGAGVDYAVSTDWVASTVVAGLIFEPDAAEFVRDLLTADPSDTRGGADIQEYQITPGHDFVGRNYGNVFETLVREYDVVPIALAKRGEDDSGELLRLPENDVRVEQGDYLIVVLEESRETTLEHDVFGVTQGTLP
jgi:voltage-gated potassium channel